DSVSNGLYILPGAGAFAAVAGHHPPLVAVAGAWLWTMAMHTFSAIPDIEPDQAAGIETTATWLGHRGTLAYCLITWGLAAVAFGSVDLRLGGLLAIYPGALVAWLVFRVPLDEAYWWYPGLNAIVGAAMTLGGLWELGGGGFVG
ncbi:MAG: UbiA family prenyltransferase, partial [Candidatus Thermoplasmatota archaeon]|nr:UbiA family prenyltransferase [Candidatus Thermoplasmatota archaeon]